MHFVNFSLVLMTLRVLQSNGQDVQDCYNDWDNGESYRGVGSTTVSGFNCQNWTAQTPHEHTRTPENYPFAGLENNYCRNPDLDDRPWCYTTERTRRWEYCDIPICSEETTEQPVTPSSTIVIETSSITNSLTMATTKGSSATPAVDPSDCYNVKDDGASYRGAIATSESGYPCQKWVDQSPHKHSRTPANFPEAGLDNNYCRNPDNEERPWCYTTNPKRRWQYCNVPQCIDISSTTTVSATSTTTETPTPTMTERSASTTTETPTPTMRERSTSTTTETSTLVMTEKSTFSTPGKSTSTTPQSLSPDVEASRSPLDSVSSTTEFQPVTLETTAVVDVALTEQTETIKSTTEKNRPCESNPCHVNATCLQNGDSSYSCQCSAGLRGDGVELCRLPVPCEDTPCHAKAICYPIGDEFRCQCRPGYEGDGTFCQVVNRCRTAPCHRHAICQHRADGGLVSICHAGYRWDGKHCRKILPCDSSPCHPNATCLDVDGRRYVCSCNEGYQGDGKVCKNQCGPNQYYTKCGTVCPPNCGRQNSEGCRRGCNSDQRCFCKQGYVERSETDKTCIPVDSCPQCFKELPEPRNSYVRCSNERKVGSVCSWFCLSGFKVQGTSKSVCRRDRTWSVLVPPICVPDKSTRDSISKCPVLVVPENSLMECTDGNYPNSKCTFTCLSHYILRGSSERVCSGSNSKWTGTLTFCEEISCTEIEERNGLTKVCYYDGEAVVGSVCIFSCTEDKKFVGSRILTCLAEGIWSRRIPRCTIPDCSIEPALFPNVIKECAPIPSRKTGKVCVFSCEEGYELSGPTRSYCYSGNIWTNTSPTCRRVTCRPSVKDPRNGFARCSNINFYESQCSFVCNEGFILQGAGRVTCGKQGRWSDRFPTCQMIKCPPIRNFNGLYSCSDGQNVGSICRLSCQPGSGFPELSATRLECVKKSESALEAGRANAYLGRWDNPIPRCVAIKCPRLGPTSQHATRRCLPLGYNVGTICTFRCDAGYRMSGAARTVCNAKSDGTAEGEWSKPQPSCQRSMPCDLKPCHINANCWNGEIAGYLCQCKKGYTGDGKLCKKILPCDSNPCDQNADCKNQRRNRFTCKCRNGYTGDGDTCTKILPCGSNPCDQNADCKNERGNRFTCKCRNGYKGDGTSCEKIMPCDSKPCDQNADCKNERGNRFSCKCRDGYKGDGETCEKILPCDSNPCDPNADCKNERGNRFTCKCKNGYKGDGTSCEKIMPCDSKPCDQNADCKNERGNRFTCKCKNGYKGDGTSCEKIMPCEMKPCDQNADCKNELGNRFTCKCRNGYRGDGSTCTKILPCDSNPCDVNAECKNERRNRFSCKCRKGYKRDGETCAKILPCDSNPCDQNADCRNELAGRFSCKCRDGFRGDGETCKQILPCDANPCERNAECKNERNNRYSCKCKGGYEGDGKTCTSTEKIHCPNIDDIRHGNYRTSSEAPYAVGAVANFDCDVGFKANGKFRLTCLIGGRWSAPIPYCIANVCKRDLRRIEQGRKCRKPCKQDSQCKGAFKRCQCDDWCGRSCFNPNADCVLPTQPRNGYIIENGRSYGQTVTYGCDEGFTLNGPSTRICRSDRAWSGHTPICLPYSACGQSVEVRGSSSFGKVRGGSNAKQGAWPWQALLIRHLKRTVEKILDMQDVFGGGSVINDEWILSAAHVFDDLFYLSTESNNWDNTFLIILGMTNYPNPKPGHGIPDHFQIFQPQDVHLHPKFNPQSFDYDIALIRVGKRVTSDGKTSFQVGGVHESRKITFTRYVRPVCLPCMKEDPAKLLDVIEGYFKKICPREGRFWLDQLMLDDC